MTPIAYQTSTEPSVAEALLKTWGLFDRKIQRDAVILLILMIIGAAFEAIGVGLIFQALLIVSDTPSESDVRAGIFLKILRLMLDAISSVTDKNPEAIFLWLILLFFILKNIYLALLFNFQLRFGWINKAKFSTILFQRYLNFTFEEHVNRNSATVLRNVTTVVADLFFKLITPAIMLITELLVVSGICFVLFHIAPIMTLVAATMLAVTAIGYYFAIRRRVSYWAKQGIKNAQRVLFWANQGLGGFKEIKLTRTESFFTEKFKASAHNQAFFQRRILVFGQLPRFLIEVIAVTSTILSIIYILPNKEVAINMLPVIGLFAAAAFRLFPAIGRIVMHANNIRAGTPAIDIIFNDLAHPDRHLANQQTGNPRPLLFKNKISFKNVSHQYSDSEELTLKDISIDINRGEKVAFVGPSGAGKSTLIDLFLGLLETKQGRIELDGKLVKDLGDSWSMMFGYVPQEIFLMDGTLRENISFGRSIAQEDILEVERACELAQLSVDIEKMPDGLETIVGERGARISGGQRQRIGIARALYSSPQILVFDEATSALDRNTESELMSAIGNISREITVVVIAHNLSLVKNFDRIYYLENGQILDRGSFAHLDSRNIQFHEMVKKSGFSG